jgi:PKD repeat protein
MNTKEMMVSIVTAMMVMAMFASSAMAIDVDGRAPAGEWEDDWHLADDLNDEPSPLPLPNGYNISAIWQHYVAAENGKLYIRYDTIGIAGDTTGNGIPHPPPSPIEGWGVGDDEQYVVGFDVDNNAATGAPMMGYPDFFEGFDLIIIYKNNAVSADWYGGITAPPGFVAEAAIATDEPYTHVVEFSVNNVDAFMDWHHYRIYGFAGSLYDTGNPEDPLSEPIEVLEFDFDWTGICCYNMSFTGSSCGNIVNHTWDFGDGTTSGVINGAPGTIIHQYSRGGLPKFNVVLSGCNQKSCTSISKAVYVDKGPTAKATRTPAKIDVDTPTSVTFDGSASHPDLSGDPLRTITYKWEFSDSHPDAYTAVVTRSVTLGPHGTLSATLTVDDSHCESDVTVVVTTNPPEEVPILTPAGMVALIGMLCIVGAGRILTKGRRS